MTTIEPPSTTSIPATSSPGPKRLLNLACPRARYFGPERRASSEAPPSFAAATKPGAPDLDSDVWASSQARPSSLSRNCLLLLACLVLTTTLHAQNWQLTWSDEFNAPNGSPPDPAKWNIVTAGDGFGNNEQQTYTSHPDNLQQQNGNLVITARKEDLTGPDGIPRHFTSGRLNTQNRFTQKYGRFEARIQLPTGKGIWPAFWLLGDNHETAPWPDCGEIDILETIGAPNSIYSTLHGPGYSGRKGLTTKFPLPAGESVNTAFHLYAVEWSPDEIKFFFDDHLIARHTPADLPPNTHWIYDHPFYVLLNLAVGGYWPGYPDDTTIFPQQMLIDYVRVYSRKPESAAATKQVAPRPDR